MRNVPRDDIGKNVIFGQLSSSVFMSVSGPLLLGVGTIYVEFVGGV